MIADAGFPCVIQPEDEVDGLLRDNRVIAGMISFAAGSVSAPASALPSESNGRALFARPTGNRGTKRVILTLLVLTAGFASGAIASEIETSRDPETGLRAWSWSHEEISLRLLQLLPDRTRAFFLGRGFPPDAADRIGRSCVFQTIFRNDGTHVLEYDLGDWSILHQSNGRLLRTRETWDLVWETRKIAESARIAFRWALLPTVQRFEPGDYNWGMTSFGLPPGEHFGLSLVVAVDGKPVNTRIRALQRATDR